MRQSVLFVKICGDLVVGSSKVRQGVKPSDEEIADIHYNTIQEFQSKEKWKKEQKWYAPVF